MDNHFHHHCENGNTMHRIAAAIVLFAAGLLFPPFFAISFLIAGYDVLFRALRNILRGKVFDENFLMSIAAVGAICIKEIPEAAMVMILYQIGEFLQDRAAEKSMSKIKALTDLRPDYANLDGAKVPPEAVKTGDIIVVKTGEKIPLDGVIIEGIASINTSAVTGESQPRSAVVGDEVLGGYINTNGVLKIRVTRPYSESAVSKIMKLLEYASEKKARSEKLITKFARYYTPIVAGIALMTVLIEPSNITRALTFLVISCPCALVISVPMTFFAGIGGAASAGILMKGGGCIEALANPDTIVFDKTGTLTSGKFEVVRVDSDYPDLLKYTAYAESASPHPMAEAVRKVWGKEIPAQDNIREFAGCGVKIETEGKTILAGSAKFAGAEVLNREESAVYVSIDGKYAGKILLADEIKTDAKGAIDSLKNLGIKVQMFTGDSYAAGKKAAQETGIDTFYTDLLPSDKLTKLEEIMSNAKNSVIFAGDGINDAPVLMRADAGIAMGRLGSDAAIESADAVIMDDKPLKVASAVQISKKTMTIVKQNIIFSIGVKVLFLFLGGFGIVTMWGAVFADVGITLIAVLNALRAGKLSYPAALSMEKAD